MKTKRLIEVLAEIDGYSKVVCAQTRWGAAMCAYKIVDGDEKPMGSLPDYLHPTEGYVHMHRIINGMGVGTELAETFIIELMKLLDFTMDEPIGESDCHALMCAEVAQIAEAIAMAYGKWEEN